ncbi:MAG: 50S ribosomal protein L21 [Magnetococcales bacterium]|nr:50S ribosomal protein L21 [Magnetococcales bacterium]MBF0113808.1 50S ribosomal protein L21 [Magnetococcales bacterium]
MYAVVRTGGKQYKVAVNDLIRVETLPGEQGDAVALQDVLLIDGEDGIKVGGAIAGAQVEGIIVRQMREKKILVFKKQRRKNYRRRQGHRQNLTELKITAIHSAGSAA